MEIKRYSDRDGESHIKTALDRQRQRQRREIVSGI